MMHHPNMHHQAMAGHPPQHIPGHQGMPGHHQIPPHQMHRENRHVTLTRVPLGPSQGGGMGGHGQAMGGMGAMPVPHHATGRAPHAIRSIGGPPAPRHLSVAPQMKQMRGAYAVGGAYGAGGVVHYPQPAPLQPSPVHHAHAPAHSQPVHNVLTQQTVITSNTSNSEKAAGESAASEAADAGDAAGVAAGDGEAARPAAATQANSKEKTPMCLVNELARYNKIKHQYRLTSETGPAHKKVFTVTLRLGETEEYTAEGSSIKRAQHAAAHAALADTGFPPPPPRAAAALAPPHAHHRHAVMPTVELNALAMKLCQPAVYTSVPPLTGAARVARLRPPTYRGGFPPPAPPPPMYPRILGPPPLIYRVRVTVGDKAWLGEGATPQAARHDAAARALLDLRPRHRALLDSSGQNAANDDEVNSDPLNEVKSPVSLVHELALKRNQLVHFSVKSERGPPHMRVFMTICKVGEIETEGEGNGKKVSKRRAAERMLEEIRRRWPPSLLRPRPQTLRRTPPAKKKPRNLIKEGAAGAGTEGLCGLDNPISVLAVARHAARARSPQYRVLEERGAARRREFLVQCDAPPHHATGLGPNKKTAKRRAAHNVLIAMEMGDAVSEPTTSPTSSTTETAAETSSNIDSKRKDSDVQPSGANSEVRQPVPGVLLMDYHQRSGQPQQPNGVSETSATGGAGGNTPGAKDQLMYLSQLLGFTVQFSDFPKRNHGEYLSLVSLSTEPPVMCHGGGPSTDHSHEQCARAALRALALMGLDAPAPAHSTPVSPPKQNGLSNGVAE